MADTFAPMPPAVDEAFADYYEIGAERSLSKLAARYRARGTDAPTPPTRRLRTLAEWSRQYGWSQRLALLQLDEIEDARLAATECLVRLTDQAVIVLGE